MKLLSLVSIFTFLFSFFFFCFNFLNFLLTCPDHKFVVETSLMAQKRVFENFSVHLGCEHTFVISTIFHKNPEKWPILTMVEIR